MHTNDDIEARHALLDEMARERAEFLRTAFPDDAEVRDDARLLRELAEAVATLIERVRQAEAERDEAWATIREALSVARSGSVPIGVSEARHFDRLLAETRAVLLGDELNGETDG